MPSRQFSFLCTATDTVTTTAGENLGDRRSFWQSRPRTLSPPAWRLGQRRSRLKFQTGWGRNFIQERRESTSTMRVQSHRELVDQKLQHLSVQY
jgi:hypothetical protein